MGSNRKLLFGVLLVVGAVVVGGLYRAFSGANSVPTPAPTPSAQLVSQKTGRRIAKATVDIPQGSIVTKDMFEMVPLTGGAPTTGFITDPDTQALGYITSTDIPKGAQLRPNEDFVGHITDVGIAAALRPGTRAIVVPFANKPTLHDLVRIGNYVDINAAFDGQEARTIVQGVRVLAVDVFGNDFPSVNVAMRGPYRADVKPGTVAGVGPGVTTASGAPVDPNATPTPAPTAAPARPDPAVTFEVSPEQANAILLAQASGATLDFVLLPALPGSRTPGTPGTLTGPDSEDPNAPSAPLRAVSITKARLAPYAESKKNTNGGGGTRVVSTGGGNGGGSSTRRNREPLYNVPDLPAQSAPTGTGGMDLGGSTPMQVPTAIPAPQTYDIPIYADGKTVRVETVRRPQE
jgi:Flp pilus assembly protein CpaB